MGLDVTSISFGMIMETFNRLRVRFISLFFISLLQIGYVANELGREEFIYSTTDYY